MDTTLGKDASPTTREVSRAFAEGKMTDWMTEEYGPPHKDGKIRWYVVGFQECEYAYLGWFDMTEWDDGFDEVLSAAKLLEWVVETNDDYRILRHDQLLCLQENLNWALQEAMKVKGETTPEWWCKKLTQENEL